MHHHSPEHTSRARTSHIPSSFWATERYGTRAAALHPLRRRAPAKSRYERLRSAANEQGSLTPPRPTVPYRLVVLNDQALWGECEPSDAQLVELSTRAFAGVRLSQVERLRRLRAEIDVARTRALQRLDDAEVPRAKP